MGSATRIRSWLVNLGVALGSLLLTLLALEAAARVVVARRVAQPLTTRGSIVRYHPTLGWSHPPGATAWLHREEYAVHLQYNSHGLRGPEADYAKPAGRFRTLLLGDSFTDGYTVDEDKSVRAVLERELSASCGRHQVLNAGTIGYSTDQEYLFFQQEGYRYQPDVVVVLFCWNDLYFNTTGEQGKPYFELVDGRLALRNSPVPEPRDGVWLRTPEARQLSVEPWRGSMALRLLAERTRSGNPRLHERLAALGLVPPLTKQKITPDMWPVFTGFRGEVDEMWRRTSAILAALKADVAARGARLVLFYIPDRTEVNDQVYETVLESWENARKGWRRDKVFKRMQEVCASLGLPLVDPRDAFRVADASGGGAFFPKDGHWTEAGHATAGHEIARFLRQEGIVRCARQ